MSLIHFKSTLAFVLLLSITSTSCFSQSSTPPKRDYISNHLLWTTLVTQGKISSKFGYQLDIEYRRQADPMHAADPSKPVGNDHYSIGKHSYQYAVRSWIQYQPSPAVVFAISPIALFGTWTGSSFQPELRPAFQVALNSNLGRVAFMHRYRYELRYFGDKADVDHDEVFGSASTFHFTAATRQGRFRYMLRATIPLNNKTITKGTYYAVTSGEIFLRTGKNISNANLVDQIRFYGGLGYKFSDNMRVELGYMNMTAFRFNNPAKNNVEINNILWLRLTIENFNKVFTKKKKQEETKTEAAPAK
jgi:hypothetical protein